MVTRWEYRVEFIENGFEENLNHLGFLGWELISFENIGVINKTMFILKRKLPEQLREKLEVETPTEFIKYDYSY